MTTQEQFYVDAQTLVEKLLEESPTTATFLGDHRYDDRLGDHSAVGLERLNRLFRQALATFESYNTHDWPLDAQIDHTLMIQLVKSFIRNYEKLRLSFRDPGEVVGECLNGVYLLVIRDFAPLALRMKSILGRLRQSPQVLAEGRAVIEPPNVPKVWAEIALEAAQQGMGLFTSFVPTLARLTPAELEQEVNVAAQAAAAALQEHAAWIEREVLPQAAGEFAVGKELFDEMLRQDHMVAYDADELRATGWRLYKETAQQMQALAAQMDPNKTVQDLLEESKKNHPPLGGLLAAYRQKMAEARQFVIDHEIVTIPEGESLRVEPTPAFVRHVIPYAAYMMPGFLEKAQEGVFIVTPVEEGADPEAAEKKLRGHPYADIPVTALHEAYPGHHLQLTFANKVGTLPRKLGGFLSTLFVEGWAFYCEELMERLGFINLPVQKLGRLQAQLWRASRIIIDSSLHTGQMTIDEAINFLVERAELEPADAKAEVLRYTQSPTQPQSYLMGKLQILEIVTEYQRRYPQVTMRQMHDAILSCGSLPPKLMRLRLFGQA